VALTGAMYPHEGWHWRMAIASLFVGLVGIAILGAAFPATTHGFDPAAFLGGAAVLSIVGYAAWASAFWNRVRYLGQPHKSAVWIVAIVGFALAGVFIVLLRFVWNALQSMWD
jgi:hypothetical protein